MPFSSDYASVDNKSMHLIHFSCQILEDELQFKTGKYE